MTDKAGSEAICLVTNEPTGGTCPLGKDECDDCCEEYFLAYSG